MDISTWLNTSNPLAMPVGQRPTEQSGFFGPYNAYDPNNSQSQQMDMLAQTQRFNGQPLYQLDQNFTPTMSPETAQLWKEYNDYKALTPEDQMAARTNGSWFNNEKIGRLMNNTIGSNSIDMQTQHDINDWSRQFNNQIATNILGQDNGNRPSQSKMWAADQLSNKTWAGNISDNTAVAPALGNQFARTLTSQMNHGLMPSDRLLQAANTRDYFTDQLIKNPQALQTQSGTHNGAGMADQGSGNFQGVSMVDPSPEFGKWGNYDSGRSTYVGDIGGWGNKQFGDKYGGWGTQASYNAGYHAPAMFQNNSLLNQPWQPMPGINQNPGINGKAIAYNPNSSGRGSWSSPLDRVPDYGNTYNGPGASGNNGWTQQNAGKNTGGWVPNGIDEMDAQGNPIENPLSAKAVYSRMMGADAKNTAPVNSKGQTSPWVDSAMQNSRWYFNQPDMSKFDTRMIPINSAMAFGVDIAGSGVANQNNDVFGNAQMQEPKPYQYTGTGVIGGFDPIWGNARMGFSGGNLQESLSPDVQMKLFNIYRVAHGLEAL